MAAMDWPLDEGEIWVRLRPPLHGSRTKSCVDLVVVGLVGGSFQGPQTAEITLKIGVLGADKRVHLPKKHSRLLTHDEVGLQSHAQ